MLKISIEHYPDGKIDGTKVLKTMSVTNVSGTVPSTSFNYYYCLGGETAEGSFSGLLVDSYNRDVFEVIQECLSAWKEGWLVTPDELGHGGVKCWK